VTFWVELIIGVLRILLPAFVDASTPRQEDARPQPELRRRLQERIRRTWGTAAVLLLVLTCVGCARTIYVPSGEPVRLRETVKDAKVWVVGQDGKPVAGVMNLPEGWYCLPLEDEK
jgi:hypothetical protein